MRFATQLTPPASTAGAIVHAVGLTAEFFSAVGVAMVEAGASASPFGAASSAGFRRYDAALVTFGERGREFGYKRTRLNGLEVAVNEERGVAISVNSADDGVDREEGHPRARFPRGQSVRRRVYINRHQGDLFRGYQDPDISNDGVVLWMLLHTMVEDRLLLGLGRPEHIGEDGMTMTYTQRTALGSYGFPGDDAGPDQGDFPFDAGPTLRILPR